MKFLSALKKKKVPRDFYVSLIFKPHIAAAILFEKTQDNLVILSTKEIPLDADLDSLEGDDFVKVADEIVSGVEVALPENENVEKTIFSVPYTWQSDGKISKENLLKLKKICDSLELKAIGFIISAEAIVNFLHKKDGAPVSAILVEHTKNQAYVYIVKGGDIIEVHHADVTGEFVETIEELLGKVEKVDNLPAKIVLQDYEGAARLQQEFLNHEWKKELNFLQIPQVLILEKGFENEAVINGVASQMGFDVLSKVQSDGQAQLPENETNVGGEDVELASADEFGFTQAESTQKVDELETEGDEVVDTQEDSLKEKSESLEEIEDTDDFKFHEDQNVQPVIHDPKARREETQPLTDELESHPRIEEPQKKSTSEFSEDHANVRDTRTTLADKIKTMAPIAWIAQLKTHGASAVLKRGLNLKIGLILVALIALLAAGAYGYYMFFTKAEIIVFADSTVVTKDENVTFSKDDETNYEEKTIRLGTVTQEVDVSAQKEVSGTKETGEKAKGEVVVYNKTEKPVTFSKGTEITANNLSYVLTDEIKIASTSSFSTSFSSSKAKVEASQFGKEYNLPSNTNFSVDGESTSNYFAKNESAFSGGTKTELTVVSKKDIEAVRSEADKGASEKAVGGATASLENDVMLIQTPLSSKLSDEKFSKKEGEEAKNLSLTGKIVYTFGTYSKSELSEFVQQMAKDEIPEDYGFRDDQSELLVSDIKVDEDDVTGKLVVNAVFAPTIPTSKMLGQLAGKPLNNAERIIKETKGISDYTIKRKNVLPLFPAYLPFNSKNIVITVKTDG